MFALKNIVRALPLTKSFFKPSLLTQAPIYSFAFMQLFERNKLPAELDPAFKRETKPKGHLKSKARKNYSKKLNTTTRVQKQRLKNHKGLLKRLKIVRLLWCRWVQDGTESSNSSRRANSTWTETRAEPIWFVREEQDTSMHPICAE